MARECLVSEVLREQLACRNRTMCYWEVIGVFGTFSPEVTLLKLLLLSSFKE